jgi:hypothetical protein
MKYSDARSLIRSGDVLAWTHRPWDSWYDFKVQMVRLFQRSEYSHVGVAVVMGGRVWVLEAVAPHVRFVPLSNELPCFHVTGLQLSDAQLEKGLALVGKETIGYSQIEAVRAFLDETRHFTGKDIECGELVNYVLGFTCRATPAAIINYLLQNSSTLMEIQP